MLCLVISNYIYNDKNILITGKYCFNNEIFVVVILFNNKKHCFSIENIHCIVFNGLLPLAIFIDDDTFFLIINTINGKTYNDRMTTRFFSVMKTL